MGPFLTRKENWDRFLSSGLRSHKRDEGRGAVAELERSLIVERVKAGIRNARAKGKKLGRPRADVRESEIEALRASGASWRAIAKETGLGSERSTESDSGVPKMSAGPEVCFYDTGKRARNYTRHCNIAASSFEISSGSTWR